MSEIKSGGSDQYGKVKSLNGISGERVKALKGERVKLFVSIIWENLHTVL